MHECGDPHLPTDFAEELTLYGKENCNVEWLELKMVNINTLHLADSYHEVHWWWLVSFLGPLIESNTAAPCSDDTTCAFTAVFAWCPRYCRPIGLCKFRFFFPIWSSKMPCYWLWILIAQWLSALLFFWYLVSLKITLGDPCKAFYTPWTPLKMLLITCCNHRSDSERSDLSNQCRELRCSFLLRH